MKSLPILIGGALACCAPIVPAAPPEWHFEYAGGVPNKLVWQTEAGRSYDLFQSTDLASWSRVDGFPKAGTGGVMEHPFSAGTCGFFRISSAPADGDGMVLIPAGEFLMGDQSNPPVGLVEERPVHSVYVSAFCMAKHETTKASWDEVANWAAANDYDISVAGASGKAARHPAYNVTWYECVKWCNARSQKEGLVPCYTVGGVVYKTAPDNTGVVCNFAANGYRLPTEAEWEKAARGGAAGLSFPWGNTISHSQANYYASGTSFGNQSGDAGYHPTYNDGVYPYTSPVGSFAPNGYGLYDMAGNLWEWCWDWYSSSYYSSSPGTDPRGPSSGSVRVRRGGCWNWEAGWCRAASRTNANPVSGNNNLGFRPVRSSVP